MTVEEFRNAYRTTEKVTAVSNQLAPPSARLALYGLKGSGSVIVADAVTHHLKGTHLFLLPDRESAAFFYSDWEELHRHVTDTAFFFPHTYAMPHQLEQVDNESIAARSAAMDYINRQGDAVVITYPQALAEQVITSQQLTETTIAFEKGEEHDLDTVNERLIAHHFERVDFVYEPGQFAIRGGIVDIFSYADDVPYRLEFFGDELESIRTFDPVHQLSLKSLSQCVIVPHTQQNLAHQKWVSLLTFLPEDAVVWCRDRTEIESVLDTVYREAQEAVQAQAVDSSDEHIPAQDRYLSPSVFEEQLDKFRLVEFVQQGEHTPSSSGVASVQFDQKVQPVFQKKFDWLIADFKKKSQERYTNLIVSSQAKQLERIYAIFEDMQADVSFSTLNIALSEGYVDNDLKLVCYTDHQLFERYHRPRIKQGYRRNKQALTLKEIHQLQKGDYVTHIDHGIGQFSGLERIDVHGKMQEAIRLVYKDNDILYLSIHSLHRISKYSGKEGVPPKIHKIGAPQWNKTKQKTKAKVKEIAYDLIQLYARRKQMEGHAFSPDSYLQNELEASFIYEDTPDQLKATIAVKKDMEATAPMDRLICGDVGFGKTEIAIRAAFKAVSDGKQVAVLVPTTLLSLQHYNTFKKRLEGFPCTLDYINRFRSQKQITASLKALKSGETDLIIGTHKLVSNRVVFNDLGLIIIDEEQKFGVSVKDKLKTFKVAVDTLTLTATPIPRTLQFSLMGARDLSIIQTPPPNRQPVETQLTGFNQKTISRAIAYELQREGQVYIVHNRVNNIHAIAELVQKWCPGVRVGIGHGQMDGKQLEQVMVDFIDHRYDVLVATTIIESGIDVANANTMIINQAQHFGLSDLHQMRGRVGRSNKKAFCYLVAPPLHLLPSDSQNRLKAMTQFSDLGAGFNIAMRDLDIRGAGNLLGGEQSGFITDVGFEMYQKILDEALQELREENSINNGATEHSDAEEQLPVKDCTLETDMELLIPDDYVNSVTERLSLYQELDRIKSPEQLNDYRDALIDRFGKLPPVVESLIQSIALRWLAKAIGFEKLVLKSRKMIGYFTDKENAPYFQSRQFTQVLQFVQTHPSEVKMNERNRKLRLIYEQVPTVQVAIERLEDIGIPSKVSETV